MEKVKQISLSERLVDLAIRFENVAIEMADTTGVIFEIAEEANEFVYNTHSKEEFEDLKKKYNEAIAECYRLDLKNKDLELKMEKAMSIFM